MHDIDAPPCRELTCSPSHQNHNLFQDHRRGNDNMFRSLHAAEKAAIDGEGNEFDTQACLEIQKDLLPVRSAGAHAAVYRGQG